MSPPEGVVGTNTERTFIAIKPDGVQRGLVGNIIGRFETKGFKLVGMKLLTPTLEQAQGHYADLSKKGFFAGLCQYFSSGPICAMVWEGKNAIKTGRTLLGATNPADSLPGTIRGDLCIDVGRNICHGSDGPDSAKHEINFWFKPEELNNYRSHSEEWVYEAPSQPAPASHAVHHHAPPSTAHPAVGPHRAFAKGETEGRSETAGNPKYRTHDNDACLGQTAPSLEGLVQVIPVGEWAEKAVPQNGQKRVVIFWGQYHKPGYRMLPLYNTLAKKYGNAVKFVAISMDPDTSYATKFLKDPDGKYSKEFHCDHLTMVHSADAKAADAFAAVLRDTLSPVHAFIIDSNDKVVWHQDHSEVGATIPLWIGQVETQIDHMVAGEPLESNGNREGVVELQEESCAQVSDKMMALAKLTSGGGDY